MDAKKYFNIIIKKYFKINIHNSYKIHIYDLNIEMTLK